MNCHSRLPALPRLAQAAGLLLPKVPRYGFAHRCVFNCLPNSLPACQVPQWHMACQAVHAQPSCVKILLREVPKEIFSCFFHGFRVICIHGHLCLRPVLTPRHEHPLPLGSWVVHSTGTRSAQSSIQSAPSAQKQHPLAPAFWDIPRCMHMLFRSIGLRKSLTSAGPATGAAPATLPRQSGPGPLTGAWRAAPPPQCCRTLRMMPHLPAPSASLPCPN